MLLVAVAGSCAADEPVPTTPSVTHADLVGEYDGSGHVANLRLGENGAYERFIFNGMTAGGCVTFEGAGMSSGSWEYESGRVLFVAPDEPARLVVKLSGVSARVVDEGLIVTIAGTDHVLRKLGRQSRETGSAIPSVR